MTYVLIKCRLTVISELKRIKRGYGSKTFSCLHVLMLIGQGRGKRFALNVVLVLIIIIIIITVLITHYAKPQCVYKYEYRQLYITITIIYY